MKPDPTAFYKVGHYKNLTRAINKRIQPFGTPPEEVAHANSSFLFWLPTYEHIYSSDCFLQLISVSLFCFFPQTHPFQLINLYGDLRLLSAISDSFTFGKTMIQASAAPIVNHAGQLRYIGIPGFPTSAGLAGLSWHMGELGPYPPLRHLICLCFHAVMPAPTTNSASSVISNCLGPFCQPFLEEWICQLQQKINKISSFPSSSLTPTRRKQ